MTHYWQDLDESPSPTKGLGSVMDCMSEGKMDVGGSVEFKAVRTLRTYKMRITSVREEIYKIKIRNYHTEGRAKFLLGKPKRAGSVLSMF